MAAEAALAAITAAGLTVAADGNNLLVKPKRLITEEIRGLVRRHKTELLAALSSQSSHSNANRCLCTDYGLRDLVGLRSGQTGKHSQVAAQCWATWAEAQAHRAATAYGAWLETAEGCEGTVR